MMGDFFTDGSQQAAGRRRYTGGRPRLFELIKIDGPRDDVVCYSPMTSFITASS
jgi:hypothetical protein